MPASPANQKTAIAQHESPHLRRYNDSLEKRTTDSHNWLNPFSCKYSQPRPRIAIKRHSSVYRYFTPESKPQQNHGKPVLGPLRHGLGHLRYHRIVDAGFSAESLIFIGCLLATWLWYPMTAGSPETRFVLGG
jgi:hypothetical protein